MTPAWRAAREYLEVYGWIPCPVCGPRHGCSSPGKVPHQGWKHLRDSLPTPGEVDRWFRDAGPDANVAVILSPGVASDVVAIDLDSPTAVDRFQKGYLTQEVPGYRTGKGLRYLYRVHATKPFTGWKRIGTLEVLGYGSLMVMPPSLHENGNRYEWILKPDPDVLLPVLPAGLCLGPLRSAPIRPGPLRASPRWMDEEPWPEGSRNDRLFKIACSLRRNGCSPQQISQTLELLNKRNSPPLDAGEIGRMVQSVSLYPILYSPPGESA